MSLAKAPPTDAPVRTDSPRRETLRAELARTKSSVRRPGLKPKLVLASGSPARWSRQPRARQSARKKQPAARRGWPNAMPATGNADWLSGVGIWI